MRKSDKKNFKDKKEKKAYITWEDNDMDSSSDLENEIINQGLMAKDYESGVSRRAPVHRARQR